MHSLSRKKVQLIYVCKFRTTRIMLKALISVQYNFQISQHFKRIKHQLSDDISIACGSEANGKFGNVLSNDCEPEERLLQKRQRVARRVHLWQRRPSDFWEQTYRKPRLWSGGRRAGLVVTVRISCSGRSYACNNRIS